MYSSAGVQVGGGEVPAGEAEGHQLEHPGHRGGHRLLHDQWLRDPLPGYRPGGQEEQLEVCRLGI